MFRDGCILTFNMYVTSPFVMVVDSFELLWFMSDLGSRGCFIFVFRFSAHAICVPVIQKCIPTLWMLVMVDVLVMVCMV